METTTVETPVETTTVETTVETNQSDTREGQPYPPSPRHSLLMKNVLKKCTRGCAPAL
jgi:hypothetical protein